MEKTLSTCCANKIRNTRLFRFKSALLTGLAATLLALPAAADEVADVSALLRKSQYAEALAKADAYLAHKPRDAQMRFLKGVILTEQNKSAEAIAVFSKLTEDFPDLPEPYNNLAVLYAAGGQYEKARQALDKAIRTNPSYATAYENLGDIHAKLASQAYDKALQLESGNSAAKSKLTLMRNLVSHAAPGTAMKSLNPSPPPPTASQVASAAPKAGTPAASIPITPAPPAAPPISETQKPSNAKPEIDKAEAKLAAKPVANPERDAVMATVQGWARAWSAKDVKTYLNYYGTDFETPKGVTRKAWADERQARIAGKGRISVKIESPQVFINADKATVKFRQIYTSDRLSASSRKTLVLEKRRGKWQIQQEFTGS